MSNLLETVYHVEAVIKVAARCNINCSYCYVFNKGEESFKDRPIKMSRSVMADTAAYLAQGVRELGAKSANVVFHGGEPLMLGKRDFDAFAFLLRDALTGVPSVRLGVQTNAMLLDDEWIDIFARHRIGVGVSLDGTSYINDLERKDHRGRGTYRRTVDGLRLLQKHAKLGAFPWPGVISVIHPLASGKATYRHFVDDLGVRGMTFHLPMDTHDSFESQDVMVYAQFLCDVFDEWARDNNRDIYVRMFSQLLSFFAGGEQQTQDASGHSRMQHVTIESDGSVGVDELKPTRLNTGSFNVRTSSLRDFANSPASALLRELPTRLADQCQPCVWRNYCKGGLQHGVQVNRWSDTNGFDNASVLCEGLMKIYSHVAHHALLAGLPEQRMLDALEHHPLQFASSRGLHRQAFLRA
ncbi:radical SAM protein [Dyella sp. EPa41]|uniref:radical SAM protein n=1 Tax=Dyella sp. EPa41 TaxID=1561194 RepID=UPI001914DE02|nr:radical SAM protein [Dyella sp. EPa41]